MAALTALAVGLGASGIGLSVTGAHGAPLWSQLDPWASSSGASSSGSKSSGSSTVVTYAEEVPCEPTPVAVTAAPKIARLRPRHKIRRRPIVHRRIVHRAVLHKIVARAHRRHLHRTSMAVVAAPRRCIVLHSERLNSPNLALNIAPTPDIPAALAQPGPTPDFGLVGGGGDCFCCGGGEGGGGGGAFPNPGMGGGGGGGTPGTGNSTGPPSTPEPQTWLLMILGVGICGAALRRAGRAGYSAP